ncbi:thiol reductant ABC exporter subunit CydD [Mycolicibacterium confluentis]|uniref:Thiol reductant ABC exporter subunit CydD n=1 Tax=Mycolicibacterium confluentis TaxID=28047 RepID=A0A7I7XWU3_9MYCO|nr:thiol reductant ABC exporter subunit CydD [Mycolicibacterium confluentis]BBZ33815.1 thiol reductant ABC exporter subunit CydD [Mycolicibacterium confluentis]
MTRASASVRRFLLATVCCGVVTAAATIASAVVVAHLVAAVITDPATRTFARWTSTLLLLGGLWALRTSAQWAQARISQREASGAIADLSTQVLTAVTSASPRALAAQRDAAAAVVLRGLDGLRPYFTSYLPALVLAVLLTPAAVAVIAGYDVASAGIVLVALPLIPLFMVLIGLVTADRSAAALQAMTTLQARVLDLVAGIPTLRALGRADGPERRIADLNAAHRRSAMSTLRIAFMSSLVLELLATLGVALVAVSVGLRLVYGGMTLADGLTALLLAPEVFWPLRRVGVAFHAAQDGKAAADKAFELIGTTAQRPAHGTRTVCAAGSPLTLEHLSVVDRDGARPDDLTATITPGRVTVLTGPNGAGKSTTLQVIAGLTPPTSGRVIVEGVDVADLDPRAWWAQLSWLAQRPVLVPGTVAENLQLFGPVPRLDEACTAAGFDEVLADLPLGTATVLGRGGVGLSLGQRQRLGLARTLGSSAPVLLFDEPTAHLDPDTEARVLAAISERAHRGDTVVIVGHRHSVLAIADDIVEVSGRVAV